MTNEDEGIHLDDAYDLFDDSEEDCQEELIRLYYSLYVALTDEHLEGLSEGTIVLSEPAPGEDPVLMIKEGSSWGGTPSFPALILVNGNDIPPIKHRRRSARSTDPASSHRAGLNRDMKWDSMSAKALRVFAENQHSSGLTYDQVSELADKRWGKGALGVSPWKRASELHTDYDPPLIERATDDEGNLVEVDGGKGVRVEAYRISSVGKNWLKKREGVSQ